MSASCSPGAGPSRTGSAGDSSDVPIEEPIQEDPREVTIVGDLLVELEVGLDHVLNFVIHQEVEGEAGVVGWIYLDTRFERGAAGELLFELANEDLVVLGEVRAESTIQLMVVSKSRSDTSM